MSINYQEELEKIKYLIKEKQKKLEEVKDRLTIFPNPPKFIRPIIICIIVLIEIINNTIIFELGYFLLKCFEIFSIELLAKSPFKIIKYLYRKEIEEIQLEINNLENKKLELENNISKDDLEFKRVLNIFYEGKNNENNKDIISSNQDKFVKVKKLVKRDNNKIL